MDTKKQLNRYAMYSMYLLYGKLSKDMQERISGMIEEIAALQSAKDGNGHTRHRLPDRATRLPSSLSRRMGRFRILGKGTAAQLCRARLPGDCCETRIQTPLPMVAVGNEGLRGESSVVQSLHHR